MRTRILPLLFPGVFQTPGTLSDINIVNKGINKQKRIQNGVQSLNTFL